MPYVIYNTRKIGYLAQLQRLSAIGKPTVRGNTMKLRKIGNNETELTLSDGTQVLISYETPVAAYRAGETYRTSKKWSATTSKHINKWLDGRTAIERDQSFFDELLVIAEK